MTDSNPRDETLSRLLLELSSDTYISMDAVRATVAQYPNYEAEILGFALDWNASDDAAPETPAGALSSPDLSQLRREGMANPFDGKTPAELRAIASFCDIPVTLLMKLHERLIEVATIPLSLLRELGERLSSSTGDLLSYLDREQTLSTADYKAAQTPQLSAAKMTFASAVKITPMPETQRSKWLKLAE